MFINCCQMSKSRKIVIVATFLIASQAVRFFLEGSIVLDPTARSPVDPVVERVAPGAAEHVIVGRYVVHYFYKSEGFGTSSIDPSDVTLVLHGSVDRLYRLIELAEVWGGPISMSVFAPGSDAAFVDDAIDGLRLCWSTLRRAASFHLVYPASFPPNMSSTGSFVYLSCKDIIRRLRLRRPRPLADVTMTYPHNAMRNVAQGGVLTNHMLQIDADLIPSKHLRSRFLDFVKRNSLDQKYRSSRDVYVLPVFEVRQGADPVRSKRDLIMALEDKNARPFRQETCPSCHKATDYEKWTKGLSYSPYGTLRLTYSIKYASGWEPFFISSRLLSRHNPNLTSYGEDRLAHMCDLQSQNYKFHVFEDEFLLYGGYRTKAKISERERRRKDDPLAFQERFRDSLKRHGFPKDVYDQC